MTTFFPDLIREAYAAYESEQYAGVLAVLSPAGLPPIGAKTFNTIFCKPPIKVESYDYFHTLRRASGHNAYFHIPFCSTGCFYCSYEKVPGPPEELIARYISGLQTEIDRKRSILGDNFSPDIFYMGGGTPTLLSPKAMRELLRILDARFFLGGNREFTVETTPRALLRPEGAALIDILREHGVNRINVGVQSFAETVARKNGRQQSARDIEACFELLRRGGFEKINLDLMYGLLGQSPEIWLSDLERAVALQPDSITTFSLRVRPPSHLHQLVSKGLPGLPGERDVLVMRMLAQRFLPAGGYFEDNADYFIRSADKRYLYQPFQPHNIHRNLVGFGSSAYSLAADRQIFNVVSTADYLRLIEEGKDPIGDVIELDRGEHMRKRLAEGLRTVFDDRAFRETFGVSACDVLAEPLRQLRTLGLLERGGEQLRLTPKGKVLHDHVAAFIKYFMS